MEASAGPKHSGHANKYQHISPVLGALQYLPAHFHPSFKVMVLTYKALNALGPWHLAEHLFGTGTACLLTLLMQNT